MWINRAEVEDNCSEKIKGCGKRMKSLWKIKKWSSAVFQSIGIEQGVVMEYEERENEKEDYRTDPAFFRKGSGWNDVDIYNKSVGTSG